MSSDEIDKLNSAEMGDIVHSVKYGEIKIIKQVSKGSCTQCFFYISKSFFFCYYNFREKCFSRKSIYKKVL